MVKEIIETNSYKEKIRLIQELVDEINKDLDEDRKISCTPDMIVVPIFENGEKVAEKVFNVFRKGEESNGLVIVSKEDKDSSVRRFNAKEFILNFIKESSNL